MLRIRPARPEETLEVQDLLHRAHAWNLANGFNFTAASITTEELASRMNLTRFFVAEDAGRILGTLELKPEPEPGRWSLHLLAVEPSAGKRGIGRALVHFAEEHALRQGAHEIVLDTPENHPWLPAFYAQLGYRILGTVQWDGKHYRSILMGKDLTVDVAHSARLKA